MNETTAKKTAAFVHQIRKECGGTKLTVIFHGGEPLLAPISVWEVLLYELTAPGVETDLSIQSNLWALGDAFLELFRKYNVKIGTSLDGPCEICDRNRGDGYYGRTMTGMKKAREAGIPVNAIATLTRQTAPDAEEILTFFRNEGISPVLHCAIKSLDEKDSPYALTPDEYADTLIRLYPWYIKNRKYLKIRTLDSFCRGAVLGDPRICTFGDCSNLFLAISPTGDITSCQRLTGKPDFIMGNISTGPTLKELYESPAARRIHEREEQVSSHCKDCPYLPICHGGCYYNALSTGDGVIDPLCEAYKRIYGFIESKLAEEVGSEENRNAILRRPARREENPLLRSGPYISLSDEVHPSRIAENAREILAAHALGMYGGAETAARRLVEEKICGNLPDTEDAMRQMCEILKDRPKSRNNCYLHVTFWAPRHFVWIWGIKGSNSHSTMRGVV